MLESQPGKSAMDPGRPDPRRLDPRRLDPSTCLERLGKVR